MTPLRVERFEMLDSTNLHARRQVQCGAVRSEGAPVLFLAREQSGGVGRLGRAWSSPRGGLWMTLARPIDPASAGLPTLGLRIGAACLASVLRLAGGPRSDGTPREVHLKWPNDVLIGGRKVLGALCETVRDPLAQTWVLIGVGVNANFHAARLPAGLRRPPTTLLEELGAEVDLEALREDLCARLLAAVSDPEPAAALALAREHLYARGGRISLHLPDGSAVWGTLETLSGDGLPVVRTIGGDIVAPAGAEIRVTAEGTR